MLTNDQIDFYNRWRQKGNIINPQSVEDWIDKYVSYFVAFNFLYNTVTDKVIAFVNPPARQILDNVQATIDIINFTGAQEILDHLHQSNRDNDIADLLIVMQQRHFNISISKQGQPRPQEDLQLTTDLASNNPSEKALAILKILYKVRCNIVHGRKGLQPYQMLLLEPVTNLLASIIALVFNRLQQYPV